LQQIKKLKINKNELNNLGHQYMALSLRRTMPTEWIESRWWWSLLVVIWGLGWFGLGG